MTMRSILPAGDHHRGKPGRPRKVQPRLESGHNTGTAGSQSRLKSVAQASPLALQALVNLRIRSADTVVEVRADETVNLPPDLNAKIEKVAE
ncbi:MAG: hypothetical protein O7F12_03195 [Nitrospirae bacterium]|nr:hypothetical protein [Nitrospirota bacterium]